MTKTTDMFSNVPRSEVDISTERLRRTLRGSGVLAVVEQDRVAFVEAVVRDLLRERERSAAYAEALTDLADRTQLALDYEPTGYDAEDEDETDERELERAMKEHLAHGPIPLKQLSKEMGVSKRDMRPILKRWLEDGDAKLGENEVIIVKVDV